VRNIVKAGSPQAFMFLLGYRFEEREGERASYVETGEKSQHVYGGGTVLRWEDGETNRITCRGTMGHGIPMRLTCPWTLGETTYGLPVREGWPFPSSPIRILQCHAVSSQGEPSSHSRQPQGHDMNEPGGKERHAYSIILPAAAADSYNGRRAVHKSP